MIEHCVLNFFNRDHQVFFKYIYILYFLLLLLLLLLNIFNKFSI